VLGIEMNMLLLGALVIVLIPELVAFKYILRGLSGNLGCINCCNSGTSNYNCSQILDLVIGDVLKDTKEYWLLQSIDRMKLTCW